MDELDPIARFRLQRCYHCGYDLRGLESGTCPECGLNLRGALVFSGSSWVRFGAILFTAVAAMAVFKDIAQFRIALRHLLPDVGFVLVAVICWMQTPRRGIARDGSAIIVTEAGALHPRMLWVKVIPWEWIDTVDIESIHGGRPSDDPLVAKKSLLAVHLIPPPRAARWWRDFINVFSIQVIRTPFFANEAELHALRHTLVHLEATGSRLEWRHHLNIAWPWLQFCEMISMNPALDPNVDDDRRCIECDYALRGLPSEGRCPECGTPYEGSTIVVDSAIGHGQHPSVLVPIYLVAAIVAWFGGCGIMSFALVIYCLGVLAQALFAVHQRSQAATRARCVFTREGFTQCTPLGTTTVMNWNAVGSCILNRATLVRWRRQPFCRSYRIRLSRSRWPFLWRGFKIDTWFDATQEQVEAIAQLIKISLRVDARTWIRVEPEIASQRDGTSFGQFR